MADKAFGKQKTCNYKSFVGGSSKHMVSKGGVATQESGVSGTTRGASSSFGVKGGSGHMVGKQSAKPSKVL